jgi:tRNA threonylcarbamoyladenosine biosynthesis protein TsaE
VEEFLTKSPEEMESFGAGFASRLTGREVICISGELGSGKTTFVRGLAKGLGIKEGYQVRSPTFTLVNQYPTQKGTLIHVDLYRVPDFDWSQFIGEGIVVVEWQRCAGSCDYCIEIEIRGERERRVRVKRSGTEQS